MQKKRKLVIITVAACVLAAGLMAGGYFLAKLILGSISSPDAPAEKSKATQSFGNQRSGWAYVPDGNWIYGSDTSRILKFQTEKPETCEEIYGLDNEYASVLRVFVSGDWIFFQEEADYCKMKRDGSGKKRLEQNVRFAVVTDTKILYNTFKEWENTPNIYSMDLDGNNKKKVLEGNYEVWGVDKEWIYYVSYDFDLSEDPYIWKDIYRMKPDGTEQKKILTFKKGKLINFVADDNQVVFAVEENDRINLKIKTINGKETSLAEIGENPGQWTPWIPLNKEGDWIYYADENKAYKIKATGGEKELVYEMKNTDNMAQTISFIFANKGELLLGSDFLGLIYIKEDGSAIELKR